MNELRSKLTPLIQDYLEKINIPDDISMKKAANGISHSLTLFLNKGRSGKERDVALQNYKALENAIEHLNQLIAVQQQSRKYDYPIIGPFQRVRLYNQFQLDDFNHSHPDLNGSHRHSDERPYDLSETLMSFYYAIFRVVPSATSSPKKSKTPLYFYNFSKRLREIAMTADEGMGLEMRMIFASEGDAWKKRVSALKKKPFLDGIRDTNPPSNAQTQEEYLKQNFYLCFRAEGYIPRYAYKAGAIIHDIQTKEKTRVF